MANIKDLFSSSTASVQQPPTGVNVKATTDKSVAANTLNQAEAQEQAEVHSDAKAFEAKDKADPNYIFKIEQGAHKLEITSEHGGVYNFHAKCSCAWEGRFLTSGLAEQTAKKHVFSR